MLGRTVGRFKIVAELGRGGMGSVWKAEDPLLGRFVALKFLPQEVATSQEACRRFMREARATSALHHPGIATLYDAGEDHGRLFIAVSFVDGETVADRVAPGPLPLAEAIRIAAAAADALEHAHIRGIIHRDVSARNIMVARDDTVVVIDFGLALPRNTKRITSSNHAIGTLAYLAPEGIRGKTADARSDVYGLGIVLYEMVTGSPPWPGDRPAVVVYAALNERPEAPRVRRPEVPLALNRIILRAIEKDPDRRFQSAAHFAQVLRAVTVPAIGAEGPLPHRKAPPRTSRTPRKQTTSDGDRPLCLAVAPFEPAGPPEGDASQNEAFARGLADVLAASFARIPNLQVIPPSGVGAAGAAGDVRSLCRRLAATHLLQGSIRRVGNQVRVTFSIISGRDARQVAGDQVTGETADWFAIEDALLASVLRAIRVGTAPAAVVRNTGAVVSHEQYLQALGHLGRTDNASEVDMAIRMLEQLLASEGDTALVHAAMGEACLRKFEVTREKEWHRRGEASCRLAATLDPHAPEVQVTLGRLYVHNGQYEEAVAALHAALATREDNPDAYRFLSRAFDGLGRSSEAIRSAERAIAVRPGYWKTYDQLGLVHFRRGDYRGAIVPWRHVAELTPDNPIAHANLGAAYYHLGWLEEAKQSLRRSLDVRPHASAFQSLGTVQFFLGQMHDSVAMFERATELMPRDSRAWGNLADALRWIPGEESRSSAAFDRAIALIEGDLRTNPRESENWSYLGKWLAKRDRIAEALSAIGRALEMAPESVSVQARAVTIYDRAGDRERAMKLLNSAVKAGYSLVELERDPELEKLRQDADAQRILAEARDVQARTQTAVHEEADNGVQDRHHHVQKGETQRRAV